MPVSLILALLAATPGPACPPPVASAAQGPRAAGAWVPLRADADVLVIDLELNGRPVAALVDTGWPWTTVDRSLAGALALPPAPSRPLFAPDGAPIPNVGGRAVLRVGGVAADQSIVFADLGRISRVPGQGDAPILAVLGADFLACHATEFDLDRQRMRIVAGGMRGAGGRAPLGVRQPGFRLVTRLVDGAGVALPALVDTGMSAGLTLRQDVWDRLSARSAGVTDMAAQTMAGALEIRPVARIAGLSLGGRPLPPVPAAAAPRVLDSRDSAVIGMEVLRGFHFILDPEDGALLLLPRARPVPPPARSTSGIQGGYADGSLRIAHVMRNSPAAAAGLRAGDAVCGIDGARPDASWNSAPRGLWTRAPAGTRTALRLCDGRRLVLTARDFY
jgi:predicted aspartyl protease